MKKANLFIRYFGVFIFLVGIVLNVKMYVLNEWPTYLFFVLSFLGILLIGISCLKWKKKINVNIS